MTEYNRSANKLQDEAEEVRTRLEKERQAVAASQEEAAAARKAQEQEKREAQEKLAQVEAELQREREVRSSFLLLLVCFLNFFGFNCSLFFFPTIKKIISIHR